MSHTHTVALHVCSLSQQVANDESSILSAKVVIQMLLYFTFHSTQTCSMQFTLSLSFTTALVLTSRSLTSLELIKVPTANAQTTLVLIHTPAEAGDILGARPGLRLRACVDLVLGLELGALEIGLSRRAAAAAEPTADGVAD